MSENPYISVPRKSSNAGRPTGKLQYIYMFKWDDVDKFTKDEKGVRVTALSFLAGKKPIGVYATSSTVAATASVEGEDDARGYIHKLAYEHPGTTVEYDELMNSLVNESLGAIVFDCLNADAKVLGNKETPLKVTQDNSQDDKDANKNAVELTASLRSGPIGRIAKSLIPLTDSEEVNAALGLSGDAGV